MTILIILLMVAAAAVTFVLFYSAHYHRRRARIHEKLPVTPVGNLDDEGMAKVVGKVVEVDPPLQSPLSKCQCVYYRLRIERERASDEGPANYTRRRAANDDDDDGDWETVVEATNAVSFAVEDDTGMATVEAKHIDVDLKSRRRVDSGYLKALSAGQEKALTERFPDKQFSFTKKMRYSEIVIEEGDELAVTGEVDLPKNDNPRFRSAEDAPILVSDETVNEAAVACRTQAKLHTIFSGIAGACTIGLAVWLIVHLSTPNKSSSSSSSSDSAKNDNKDNTQVANNDGKGNTPIAGNQPKKGSGIGRQPRKEIGFEEPPQPPPMRDPEDDLPKGNDLDSVLARFKIRVERKQFQWRDELRQIALLFRPDHPRRSDVFKFLMGYTENPDVFLRSDARREALKWASKSDVPTLCKLMTAERDGGVQREIMQKLKELNDPAAAETLAIFLKDHLRGEAEQALKGMGSGAEKFVIPYTKEGYDRDTRAAAIRVLESIATMEGGKVVEQLTRDADDHVNRTARGSFEALGKRLGIARDVDAILAALDSSILAKNGGKFNQFLNDLKSGYMADHPKRAEVFKALTVFALAAAADPQGFGRNELGVEFARWSSKDDVPALSEVLVAVKEGNSESAILAKLKEFKDPRCADAVATFIANFFKKNEAATVLRAIGPSAEKSLHTYVRGKTPDGKEVGPFDRQTAIEVLGDIGTTESVPVLQSLLKDFFMGKHASAAMANIQARKK